MKEWKCVGEPMAFAINDWQFTDTFKKKAYNECVLPILRYRIETRRLRSLRRRYVVVVQRVT